MTEILYNKFITFIVQKKKPYNECSTKYWNLSTQQTIDGLNNFATLKKVF